MDVTGDGSKVRCCKEQYCIETWNVRSMSQGKLEVVKQEMARVNIDILGISELKWTGISEFNSDDHYIYYCGQESIRRNGVALIVNKRVQNEVLGYSYFLPFHTVHAVSMQEYLSGLPFPSPVDLVLSELSAMIHPSWVALQGMAHSFIELGVVHVISLVSFL